MARIPRERIGEYVRTALLVLMDNDDSLRSRKVFQQAGPRLGLNEYGLEIYEKSGYVRLKICGLTGINRSVYDVPISFELPSEPEASRNGKSRSR